MTLQDTIALFNAARAAGVTSFDSPDCKFTLAQDFRPITSTKKAVDRSGGPKNAIDLALELSGIPEVQ